MPKMESTSDIPGGPNLMCCCDRLLKFRWRPGFERAPWSQSVTPHGEHGNLAAAPWRPTSNLKSKPLLCTTAQSRSPVTKVISLPGVVRASFEDEEGHVDWLEAQPIKLERNRLRTLPESANPGREVGTPTKRDNKMRSQGSTMVVTHGDSKTSVHSHAN